MRTLKGFRLFAATQISLAAVIALAAACSDDDPIGGTYVGKDASTTDGKVNPTPDSGAGDAVSTAVPPGCFAGTPSTYLEFLNACTTHDYVVVDNCARIGVCDGGALPALVSPPVPDAGTPPVDSGAGSDASTDASDDGG